MIGRFIDALPRMAMERVANARGWVAADYWRQDSPSCRCLVGHVEDWRPVGSPAWNMAQHAAERAGLGSARIVEERFDALCTRFDVNRIGRLCEARARKNLEAAHA